MRKKNILNSIYRMVLYICDLCSKEFNRKGDYVKHINRKYKCVQKIVEKPEKKDNFHGNTKIVKTVKEMANINKNLVVSKDETKKMNDKLFEELIKSNKSTKTLIKKIDSLEKEILSMKKIIKDGSSNNIAVNIQNNMNNTNNNYNLIAFGKEDTSFLTDKQRKQILMGGLKGIKKYVEMVHCNDDKPEYKNIYISNRKNKDDNVLVYDGSKWKLCDQQYIDDLRDRGIEFIEDQYENFKDRDDIDPRITKMAKRFIEHMENDENGEKKTKISDDLKVLLYNNRPNEKKEKIQK